MQTNKNERQITFHSEEFGNIRAVKIDERLYICGHDVATALGYARPNNAISRHCKSTLKQGTLTNRGIQNLIFISENDAFRLSCKSKLEKADLFYDWLSSEISSTEKAKNEPVILEQNQSIIPHNITNNSSFDNNFNTDNQMPMIFQNEEFGYIRIIEVDGKTYFCGSDVATDLGYVRPNDAISRHCRATVKHSTPISGKMQEINFVSEGDVFRLAAHSKLPGAERFERWIFDEVLPTIRRTGGYIPVADTMSDEEIVARALIIANKTIEMQKEKMAQQEIQTKEMQPKVDFADSVQASKTSISVEALAKLLKQNGIDIGRNRLFAELRNRGFLISRKCETYNLPTQRSMNAGLMEIKESTYTTPYGNTNIQKVTKITGKGQIYFVNLFLKEKQLALKSSF